MAPRPSLCSVIKIHRACPLGANAQRQAQRAHRRHPPWRASASGKAETTNNAFPGCRRRHAGVTTQIREELGTQAGTLPPHSRWKKGSVSAPAGAVPSAAAVVSQRPQLGLRQATCSRLNGPGQINSRYRGRWRAGSMITCSSRSARLVVPRDLLRRRRALQHRWQLTQPRRVSQVSDRVNVAAPSADLC